MRLVPTRCIPSFCQRMLSLHYLPKLALESSPGLSVSTVSAPESVFRELRAFEPDKHTLPFSLEPGEWAEFLLTAHFLSAGEAEGQVRIRSNDTEAVGPAPGDFRLTLRATGIDSSGMKMGNVRFDDGLITDYREFDCPECDL